MLDDIYLVYISHDSLFVHSSLIYDPSLVQSSSQIAALKDGVS